MKIIKPLTYKSRIQQIGNPNSNKFILKDNEVFATDKGIIIAPRYLYTDNITFINNTFVDIRACHCHDIACAWHKIIISDMTEEDLLNEGILRLNLEATERERMFLWELYKSGKYKGDTDVLVYICDDIPKDRLKIREISFKETNEMFRQMLKTCGVNKNIANTMGNAVYCNVGWFYKKPYKQLNLDDIFNNILIT